MTKKSTCYSRPILAGGRCCGGRSNSDDNDHSRSSRRRMLHQSNTRRKSRRRGRDSTAAIKRRHRQRHVPSLLFGRMMRSLLMTLFVLRRTSAVVVVAAFSSSMLKTTRWPTRIPRRILSKPSSSLLFGTKINDDTFNDGDNNSIHNRIHGSSSSENLDQTEGEGEVDAQQYFQLQRRGFMRHNIRMATAAIVAGGLLSGTTTPTAILGHPAIAAAATATSSSSIPLSSLSSSSSSSSSASSSYATKYGGNGLAKQIRAILFVMDELQRDLMTERYDLLSAYIGQIKSYVALLITYTDAAFPSDLPSTAVSSTSTSTSASASSTSSWSTGSNTQPPPQQQQQQGKFATTSLLTGADDEGLASDYDVGKFRYELKQEVAKFVKATDRLQRDIQLFDTAPSLSVIDEAYTAYAAMCDHLDSWLRLSGLYTYYETVYDTYNVQNAADDDSTRGGNYYYKKSGSSKKIYYGNNSNPKKDPVNVGDLIVLQKGPDTGRTGILVGFQMKKNPYTTSAATTNKNNKKTNTNSSSLITNNSGLVLCCVVKLDEYKGIREIRSVPKLWAARRTGQQPTDGIFSIPRTM